jgi:hypothetical protein
MTDRELLERAAKAAGIDGEWKDHGGVLWLMRTDFGDPWNPLTDDGDAMRLMVRLHMEIVEIYFYHDDRCQNPTTVRRSGGGKMDDLIVSFPTYQESHQRYDPCAATRRAIVRVAAEIGKEM